MRRNLGLVLAPGLVAGLVIAGPTGTASAAPAAPCFDAGVALTVEETRLTRTIGTNPEPAARQILRRSTFDREVAAFERALCATRTVGAAQWVVSRHGTRLWRLAVTRAQHGAPAGAALPGGDDRPLYWARIAMTKALRQWTPRFDLGDAARRDLERRLEGVSRGITTSDFRRIRGVRRLLVSGFDPFQLDQEIRRGNPSGAAVLRLDGAVLDLGGGNRVQIQTVVFPVRYADFDAGMVESAFRPHLRPGRWRADMVTTISQGRPGQFDLEVWNGRRRSVSSIGDNNNIWGGGSATAPVVFPGVGPGAEFLPGTLPTAAMVTATGQPFPVRLNPSVVEIPAGATAPVTRPDGPTAGSVAVSGGGGGYLSNEVAYRSTLLREQFGPVPAGHVHTPVMTMAPDNSTEVTDPIFEANRAAIAAQTELILRKGAAV